MGLFGYEGDVGFVKLLFLPIEMDGTIVNDEMYDELIEEPEDLVENNISCSWRIMFKKLILYDISELKGKKFSLHFTTMTSD